MLNNRTLASYNEEQQNTIRENMNKAIGKSAFYRGQILEHFAILEFNIEILIAEYFTNCDPLKTQQLIYSLFGQETFNFNNKRRLVIFVLKNGLSEFYKSNRKLDKKLQAASSFRNLIAHRKLDFRPETLISFNGIDVTLVSTTTSDNLTHLSDKVINQNLISIESKKIGELSEVILKAGELIREQNKKN